MSSELLPMDEQQTQTFEPVQAGPAGPAEPAAVVEVITPATSELLTCPECGTSATVTVNRRDAADFCRSCDYPLFWTPSRVIYDSVGRHSADETLRRLPGTVGQVTVASLPCPHCAEPNALSAQVCVRCHRPMQLVEPDPLPPPPEPVYAPPPLPAVYVEPERRTPWWVWALLAFGVAALITLIVLLVTHVIG